MYARFKRAVKKVFGEDLTTANQRLQLVQQVGWIIGIMIWVPGLLLWMNWLLSQ